MLLDGRPVLLLCSNNYLGLADHPRVREAAAEAAMRYGAGAGASRLVSGNMTIHRRLEEQLAAFKGAEACLLFGSGYLANAGVVSALAREGDVVFSDALNHASIIDGCRLARAETFVYDHCDTDHLEWGLRQADGRGSLIVTDGVFSMDGDVAPLERIVELAQRYDARVMVDEAHGTGASGRRGAARWPPRGSRTRSTWSWARSARRSAPTAPTCCCDAPMAKYLINSRAHADLLDGAAAARRGGRDGRAGAAARAAAAGREAAAKRPACCARRWRDEGLPVTDDETPIVPLVVGERRGRVRAGERALERGVFAQAIRPPTVPEGTLAAAPGGDGLAHEVGAARGGPGAGRLRARVGPRGAAVRVPAAEPEAARGGCSTACATPRSGGRAASQSDARRRSGAPWASRAAAARRLLGRAALAAVAAAR